jgi:hypothetical protein
MGATGAGSRLGHIVSWSLALFGPESNFLASVTPGSFLELLDLNAIRLTRISFLVKLSRLPQLVQLLTLLTPTNS